MDITTHPAFAETYAGIKRSFGELWARRFVLAAPLMFGDATGPIYQAFLEGLAAHSEGARHAETTAWLRCEELMDDLASSLVTEAEALLRSAPEVHGP